jgi:hypothetical protein
MVSSVDSPSALTLAVGSGRWGTRVRTFPSPEKAGSSRPSAVYRRTEMKALAGRSVKPPLLEV